MQTIAHIVLYKANYETLISEADFIRTHAQPGTWVDETMIYAFSKTYGVDIVLICDNGWRRVIRANPEQSNFTLFIGYEWEKHYISLRPSNSLTQENLERIKIESEQTFQDFPRRGI
jgi:hypothetical protein